MYKGRTFNKDQRSELKCRIIEGGLYNYTGHSVCHETVDIEVDESFRDESSFELEIGTWYSINAVVTEYDEGYVRIEVDKESEVDRIGEKVNDWRGGIPQNRAHHNQRKQPKSGGSFKSKAMGAVSRFRSLGGAADSQMSVQSAESVDTVSAAEQNVEGFATGGAKDIDNFRQNIGQNYIPEPESMTYEGLFYEYEFDISGDSKDSVFYPVYEHANVVDPVRDEEEHFLALGLESGIESMRRPPLDIMLVLDVSGSMSSSIRNYHYDKENPSEASQSKMQATIDVVNKVVSQLEDEDRLGVVLYNNQSYISKPIRKIEQTDTEAIQDNIQELRAGGGTNLSSGFESAVTEMKENAELDTNNSDRESRVMFFTDAMPNTGNTDTQELTDRMSEVAEDDIHTTFIGIGIDANPEFINDISGIKGSNHYFADSIEDFKERVGEEFTLMTIPLVYNLELKLEGEDYSINQVYGNPSDGEDDSRVMKTDTLFPSTGDDGAKGGVILAELDDVEEDAEVRISATWENRDGDKNSDVRTVKINSTEPDHYDSSDIRKAVVLQKYANSLRNWLSNYKRSDWEHESVDMEVADEQKEEFDIILDFMKENEDEVDDDISEEIETLEKILSSEN